jgi:hypothetical protein
MAILADVAPYSREYHNVRQRIGLEAQGNTELEIEYEKILTRVKQTRESVIRMSDRHFTAPVDEISGTVNEVSAGGVTLDEYPGRRFQFSSVGMSAADMSARILGEKNGMSRSEVAQEVNRRRGDLQEYLVSPSCTNQNPSRAHRKLPPPAPPGSHVYSPDAVSKFAGFRLCILVSILYAKTRELPLLPTE